MGASVANVLWQVYHALRARASPSGFTDELARYLLIWLGLLGAAYAVGQRMHLAIDLLPRALDARPRAQRRARQSCSRAPCSLFALARDGLRRRQPRPPGDAARAALGRARRPARAPSTACCPLAGARRSRSTLRLGMWGLRRACSEARPIAAAPDVRLRRPRRTRPPTSLSPGVPRQILLVRVFLPIDGRISTSADRARHPRAASARRAGGAHARRRRRARRRLRRPARARRPRRLRHRARDRRHDDALSIGPTAALTTVAQRMATGLDSFTLLAIPFFVLAGSS